jgi:DNA adenine methylase
MKTSASSSRLVPPIKWWGGKSYLAKKFIALMPRHLHYVEPYFGGGAVRLDKDPFDKSKYWGSKGYEQGVSEVVNDICLELTNFWRVLQSKEPFRAFKRIVEAMPFSQVEWEAAEKR